MAATRFVDVRHLSSIDSTNRYVLDEARAGAPEGLVVVADHQTAGRGRLGRRWEAPPGSNLLVSVLLRPPLDPDRVQLAASVVALAAADAVREVSGLELGIKWPNDLLAADGRKVAGILAEADLAPAGRPPVVVVGLGLNVNWPASDADLPLELVGSATSLAQQTGRVTDRDQLLTSLLEHLEPRVGDLASSEGRDRQAAELRCRCVTLGRRVRVDLAEGAIEGVASDITPDGHLVVDVGGTTRTVVAGDVVHLRPHS